MSPVRRSRSAGAVATLLASLGAAGCDDLVDPFEPTDRIGLDDPATAEMQVDSAIASFECAYSTFGWIALGHEDVLESNAGIASLAHVYVSHAPTGECDTSSTSRGWFDAMMGARRLITNAAGTGVYDRMQSEWRDRVTDRPRLSAIAAIYAAAALDHFGEFFCEIAFDNGAALGPGAVLADAEAWIDRALNHVQEVGGDFAMPHGIASSAELMARALRARIRWARGDATGALEDAESIPQGFEAWVTRDPGDTRRNRIYHSATEVGFSRMIGAITWWSGADNPVTGQPWPTPIPFTGYLYLGVMSDGRTLESGNVPIRWAEETLGPGGQPVPLNNGAVPDTRVEHLVLPISGPAPLFVPDRFSANDQDIPLVTWREVWLIRAELEGGQTAIDLVDDLRAAEGLPVVTYLDGATSTADEIRHLVIEERRRSFYSEAGRYWATKVQNTDLLWFPRGEGRTQNQGYAMLGGVRLTMPPSEYEANPNLTPADRATGCDPSQAPLL